LLDAILECNPLDDFRHAIGTVEFAPLRLSGHHQLERHGEAGFATQAALCFSSAMADGGEGAFDGVGRSNVFPMFSGKVIEGQQHVTIFGQLPHSLVVFHAVGRNEEIERSFSVDAGLSLPDIVQMALGFGLHRLRV